jgi:hypothetical protein
LPWPAVAALAIAKLSDFLNENQNRLQFFLWLAVGTGFFLVS